MSESLEGTIVAAFGRHYEVESADGRLWQAVPKAKRSIYACGDRVQMDAATLTPDPLHSLFHDSHPPASLRIARLRALSKE